MDRGGQVHEMAELLVKLRNELVHYKSKLSSDAERKTLHTRLAALKFAAPAVLDQPGKYPFPLPHLSAALAAWAVKSATGFIDEFYVCLGVANPFDEYRARL